MAVSLNFDADEGGLDGESLGFVDIVGRDERAALEDSDGMSIGLLGVRLDKNFARKAGSNDDNPDG